MFFYVTVYVQHVSLVCAYSVHAYSKTLSHSVASCKAIENNNDLLTKDETMRYLVHTNEAYVCKLYAYVYKWIYVCTLDIYVLYTVFWFGYM